AALSAGRFALVLRDQLRAPPRSATAIGLQHRHAALRIAPRNVLRESGAAPDHCARADRSRVMRVALVTSGLEHLGIEALSAWLRRAGHEPLLVYEARPFSSGSGTDSRLLARLLEPTAEQTAQRIAAARPDVVAFTSYSVTHAWSVSVARAVKASCDVPIVFGGPHVGAAPERAIREWSIDAVVEGEGEEALVDLVECAEGGRFGRTDIRNCTFEVDGEVVRNRVRPLLADLDALPWADKRGFYDAVPAFEHEFYVVSRRGCPFRCSFCEYSTFPKQYPGEKPVRRR